MYEVMNDDSGGILFYPIDDDEYRNARRRPRLRRSRPGRRRPGVPFQQSPVPYAPRPQPVEYAPYPPPYAPMPHPGYMTPPMPYGHPSSGLHVGLKAIGALLPAFGQLLGAYRRMPERPEITGELQRDVPALVNYVADSHETARAGAQAASVLATAGALMKILAEL